MESCGATAHNCFVLKVIVCVCIFTCVGCEFHLRSCA